MKVPKAAIVHRHWCVHNVECTVYNKTYQQHVLWTVYKSVVSGAFRWRAQAENGVIVGASTQGYSRKRDCINNARLFGFKIRDRNYDPSRIVE